MKCIVWLCLAAALSCCSITNAQKTQPGAASTLPPYPDRAQWWGDARFGLFIHWGPISLKGTEIGWSRLPRPNGTTDGTVLAEEYETLYRQVNPPKFNAEALVTLA